MSMAGGFLGGAQDRLLPASIPFRFFVSACLFHLLAWVALLVGAEEAAGFRGGTGYVLASIHLLALGTLAMTAIGASLQLFPVVTRRALSRSWPGHVSFALMMPGVAILCFGMAEHSSTVMQVGAVLTCAGLAIFAVITADNLLRARSIPLVAAHGAFALLSLASAATLGVLLVWDFDGGFLADRLNFAISHLVLAGFGFMGLLVLGLSLILIPMFVLSRSLPSAPGWTQLGLATLALVALPAAMLSAFDMLIWPAFAAGFGATAVYLWQMRKTLNSSMRKRLGLSFLLMRVSWGLLILTLILASAYFAGLPIPNAPSLIGFMLLAGWLLTFLLGVLQRIMPFLASMHAAGKSGLPPLMSELADEGPLKLHAICHFLALASCSAGIAIDEALLIRIGAAIGGIGAAGFTWFAVSIARKTRNNAQDA